MTRGIKKHIVIGIFIAVFIGVQIVKDRWGLWYE